MRQRSLQASIVGTSWCEDKLYMINGCHHFESFLAALEISSKVVRIAPNPSLWVIKWDQNVRCVQMKAKKQSLQFWSWESFSPLNPPPPSRSTSRLMPPAKGSPCFPHQLTKDQAPVPTRKERLWQRKAQSVTIGISSFGPNTGYII